MPNLESISGLDLLDTSNVVTTNSLFSDCEKLTSVSGVESWNTSNVTNMANMFEDCYVLNNLDFSN